MRLWHRHHSSPKLISASYFRSPSDLFRKLDTRRTCLLTIIYSKLLFQFSPDMKYDTRHSVAVTSGKSKIIKSCGNNCNIVQKIAEPSISSHLTINPRSRKSTCVYQRFKFHSCLSTRVGSRLFHYTIRSIWHPLKGSSMSHFE